MNQQFYTKNLGEIVWEGKFVAIPLSALAVESVSIAAILCDGITPETIVTVCEAATEIGKAHGYMFHHLFRSSDSGTFVIFDRGFMPNRLEK